MKIQLMPHQVKVLDALKGRNRCAMYADCGLGKTFMSSEKLAQLGGKRDLIVCQKSMVNTWINHMRTYYPDKKTVDYTNKKEATLDADVIVVNYDLVWRRKEFSVTEFNTMLLDESSMIQNETAKRSRFILKIKHKNVLLLSGTPVSGKYENLYSQVRLLGWNITKKAFYDRYIIEVPIMNKNSPYPIKIVVGYKNVTELKAKLREYGSVFMKTEEVLTLPEQVFVPISVPTTSHYKTYKKDRIVEVDGTTLVGDTTFVKFLHERQLCSYLNPEKISAFCDLLDSTNQRLIVFYNFTAELDVLKDAVNSNKRLIKRSISEVNGAKRDLTAYENDDNSVTFVQFAAGSKGLNLQKANRIVYFSPTLRCEDWQQSLKRIHRINQHGTCFYHMLVCENSIEEKIYAALERGVDYTNELFREDES